MEGHQSGERIILLAETNPALHGMLVEGLRQEGFRVVEVAEEEQFPVLFEANREQVSLAVVDEVLPRLDGERIYRTLRELDPTLPILLCINPAAHRDTPLPQDASLHVIPKPMTVERILGGVRKAVASA